MTTRWKMCINTEVNKPVGVAVDQSGNLFYTDGSCKVRKWLKTTGIVTPYAGKTVCGYAGDGNVATRAQLGQQLSTCSLSIAMDVSNNLYISDQCNHAIRFVAASTGIITTFAGSFTTSGGVVTPSSGNNGDGGAATSATLNSPLGIAVDSLGTLYIADSMNYKIRKVASNGIITTFAGTGVSGNSGDNGVAVSAKFAKPMGLVTDSNGNLYIADGSNYNIRMISSATNIITTAAGNGNSGYSGDGGPATLAKLYSFSGGMAVDKSGKTLVDTFPFP